MDSKILIAEDEAKIRQLVASYLVREGFKVVEAADGQQAVEKFEDNDDVVLVMLDVMMPRKDGYDACREIRSKSDVPILMLTARDSERDEVTGFHLGADEYIAEPFSPTILVTRVKNLLKRTNANDMSDAEVGGLKILYRERTVLVDGQKIITTPKEFDLLYYLVKNQGIVLTRDQIICTVWDMDYNGDDRTVDTHIKCLRAKLGKYASCITTVRKVGYKFEWTDYKRHPQGAFRGHLLHPRGECGGPAFHGLHPVRAVLPEQQGQRAGAERAGDPRRLPGEQRGNLRRDRETGKRQRDRESL
ncbi:MAG: response regulator transcription factor [Anaerotruncus massiliensis (ex Togo et al. 2019)]